jgi:hypothetical protein
MISLPALPPGNPAPAGRVPPGAGRRRRVLDPRIQFAIDPTANAQRYPKNEQSK